MPSVFSALVVVSTDFSQEPLSTEDFTEPKKRVLVT
jgi:hypothetical protein